MDFIKNKIEQSKKKEINKGDIIVVDRKLYQYYGIYINENEVISYMLNNEIKITSLEEFLDNSKVYYAVELHESNDVKNYKLFSAEETIARAKSRLGEKKYDVLKNNCEHFVVWCKTGIMESQQANNLIDAIFSIPHTPHKIGKYFSRFISCL